MLFIFARSAFGSGALRFIASKEGVGIRTEHAERMWMHIGNCTVVSERMRDSAQFFNSVTALSAFPHAVHRP